MEYRISDKNPKGNPNKTIVRTGLPCHISASEVRASKYIRYKRTSIVLPPYAYKTQTITDNYFKMVCKAIYDLQEHFDLKSVVKTYQ